jgi:hypothetical protein
MDKKLEVLEVPKLMESLRLINNALNNGCKEGVYNLDEAYLLKVAASNLERSVKLLDEYQKKCGSSCCNTMPVAN